MGLIRGVARTAVVAGTATAVSNRVSRRQQNRWAAQEQAAYEEQNPPPPAYGQPVYAPAEPAGTGEDDLTEKLDRLTAMKERGQLTEEEFSAAKAKLLGI